MRQKHRLFLWVTLLLTLSLMLVACERPVPDSGEPDQEETAETVPETETSASTSEEEASTADEATAASEEPAEASETGGEDSTPRVDAEEEAAAEEMEESAATEEEGEAAAETEEAAETTEEAETAEEAEAEAEMAEEEEAEEAAETEATENGEEEAAAAEAAPTTHTVAAGETLYRIGLKYNISWVTLAEFNELDDADRIRAGQVLNIPGETAVTVEPTPSPLTETTYTVQAGDNLYRIGLKYGISWVQIAEANGLVNPNQIIVGQILKIPVDTPGPTPQFTHEVKAGETLLLISLQYGVSWPAIAEANNISSPYVIFSGQTLVIPGG
jgi:LysM repeat protein